jgi:hypothetical protein
VKTLSEVIAELDARRKNGLPDSFYRIEVSYLSATAKLEWIIFFYRALGKPSNTIRAATLESAIDRLNAILDEPVLTTNEAIAHAEVALT